MKIVGIYDPFLKMAACTITVPSDWTVEGTVLRGVGCNRATPQVVYRAQSPDLLTGVQAFPHFIWFGANAYPGCYQNASLTLSQVVDLVAQQRGSSGVLERTGPPDNLFENIIAQRDRNRRAGSIAQMGVASSSGESQMARIEYSLGNQMEEEWLSASVIVDHDPILTAMGLHPVHATAVSNDARIVALRAPKGQMAGLLPELIAIMRSQRPTEAWLQAEGQYEQQIMQWVQEQVQANTERNVGIIQESTRKLQEGIAASQAATLKLQQATAASEVHFKEHMAELQAEDRQRTELAADQIDLLRGTQYYQDAATGQRLTLPAWGGWTFANPDDTEIVNTNDPSFHDRVLPSDWTQLEPISHTQH